MSILSEKKYIHKFNSEFKKLCDGVIKLKKKIVDDCLKKIDDGEMSDSEVEGVKLKVKKLTENDKLIDKMMVEMPNSLKRDPEMIIRYYVSTKDIMIYSAEIREGNIEFMMDDSFIDNKKKEYGDQVTKEQRSDILDIVYLVRGCWFDLSETKQIKIKKLIKNLQICADRYFKHDIDI